jgi:hypothetical protein
MSAAGAPSGQAPRQVVMDDEAGLEYWREHFGVTTEQLAEAVLAAGPEPEAVREHLLNQGSSAGVG